MKIIEFLESVGVSLTDEQKTSIESKLTPDVISTVEAEKKVGKVQKELDATKEKLTSTEEALKEFDGVDADGLRKKIADLEEANKKKDEDYKAEIEKRDYSEAIEKLTKDIQFSSKSAKKQFIAELMENPLQVRDGVVLGFEDYLKTVKENDPDSFVDESKGSAGKFTQPNEGGQSTSTTDDDALRKAMGLEVKKD
ncbi:MAG: phage scaffolding protein [Butyrivibrio sp.]|nr:phage scaffolding protein [Butyrivibrio sp.]